MKFEVKPKNVCPKQLKFEIEGNVVKNIQFIGGCNGNLKAISKLVNGMTVEQIESYLKGNTCGANKTSCADQLAIAVREKYDEMNR
ncbi:MAG: TIGR03905 family TSCPD domain-containing protein [Ruthenibacterium sp.]